jgi:hypothetical protein
MDAASLGKLHDLDQPLADLVASACPGCTLLNAGCAHDSLVTGHTVGVCVILPSAYQACSGCGCNVCTAKCGSCQDTHLSRTMLLAMVLAAFWVNDLKSPTAARISQSVKVWEENNTLALLNAHTVVVDGMAVPALNKRSLAAFTGWWQVLPLAGAGQGSRWACCAAGVHDAEHTGIPSQVHSCEPQRVHWSTSVVCQTARAGQRRRRMRRRRGWSRKFGCLAASGG